MRLRAYETRVFWQMRELARHRRHLAPAGRAARRARRAVARGRAARPAAGTGPRRGPGGHRGARRARSRRAVRRAAVAEATGTGRATSGAVVDRIVARAAARRAGHRVRRGPLAGGGAACLDAAGAARARCPSGRRWGPPAGPGTRSCGWRRSWPRACAARGLDEGAAWWAAERVRLLLTCRCRPRSAGRRRRVPCRLVDAWLAHPAVAPVPAGQRSGRAWSGSTASRWDELLAWARPPGARPDASAAASRGARGHAEAWAEPRRVRVEAARRRCGYRRGPAARGWAAGPPRVGGCPRRPATKPARPREARRRRPWRTGRSHLARRSRSSSLRGRRAWRAAESWRRPRPRRLPTRNRRRSLEASAAKAAGQGGKEPKPRTKPVKNGLTPDRPKGRAWPRNVSGPPRRDVGRPEGRAWPGGSSGTCIDDAGARHELRAAPA